MLLDLGPAHGPSGPVADGTAGRLDRVREARAIGGRSMVGPARESVKPAYDYIM